MAKLYISSLFLTFLCIGLILGSCTSHPTGEDNAEDNGAGAKFLSDSFNPSTRRMMEMMNELDKFGQSLTQSSSGIKRDIAERIQSTFQATKPYANSLKLQNVLLLGLILWPLAFLLLPVGCCIACVLCCVVGVVTVLICGVLLIVGTVLYSGPLADLPQDSTTATLVALAENLALMSTDAFNSLTNLIGQNQAGEAAPTVEALKQLASALGGIGNQVQQLIGDSDISGELTHVMNNVLNSVSAHLSVLGIQVHDLAVKLPFDAAHINGTLTNLVEHVQDILEKLNN